ncbi:gamma-glutamylcyclotransferase family protein [Actinoplanes sp. NPDC051861]|uniref:gamma-glutamylcyclotransferase family protein n=1 Tax=Actinoplanes sp. NPDC051861 TaxID=3155170 RepID=UPI003429016A
MPTEVADAAPGPVRPGQPAADFAVDPYPGCRPAGSWVIDRAGRCWPVTPDEGMPSGWAVGGRCLDAWLTGQGATPLAGRIPLLSYGSNACPGKVLANGTPLPVVSLACEMDGLASAWCTGRTRAGRIPATLAAVPAHSETAVVMMADPAELAVLDVIEGRATGWYALRILDTGRVTLENGARVLRPAAYVGARPERLPAVTGGRLALRTGEPAPGNPMPGEDVPLGTYPHPGECTPAVFTYGTLMPGQIRAHLIADRLDSEPWDAEVFGDLRDTGHGYPALNAAADRKAPGVLCEVRPSMMADTLETLDEVEGTTDGLYSRQLRNVGGVLAWVYVADGCAGIGVPIDAWR